MTKFAERGRAKAEARARRGAARNRARFERKLEAIYQDSWRRLSKRLDPGTRERLLDFCAEATTRVEQSEMLLNRIARWALGQADPATAINHQLNEAEAAEDARPKIDPAWLPKATEKAPEVAQESV